MIAPGKVLSLIYASLAISLALAKAEESGPSMQDYLVEHINKAGGLFEIAWAYSRTDWDSSHYSCHAISNGFFMECTTQAFRGGILGRPGGWTLNLPFNYLLLNRSEVLQHNLFEPPQYTLSVRYKSTRRDDDAVYIDFRDEAEAQRVARAFEHAAQLAGVKPDPFDK